MPGIKPVPFGQSILNLECQPLKQEHKCNQKKKLFEKRKYWQKKQLKS